MEALLVNALPEPPGWQYEPKWDGFRAIIAKDDAGVEIWSKSGKPLGRYFPEVVARIRELPEKNLLLDGELMVPLENFLSFEALQARLHPAVSRVARLSKETPAQLILFDLLKIGRINFAERPLAVRRAVLENWYTCVENTGLFLSPATQSLKQAELWLKASGTALDGVVAKGLADSYRPGERAMRKVKQLRTADCVVGGYRRNAEGNVASLLLGLYTREGKLDLVGYCSNFPRSERKDLLELLKAHEGGEGFTGRAPNGPSRWAPNKSSNYNPLAHQLVAEVVYDQVTADRFRHGTRFFRWRPDKNPLQCGKDQLVRELKPAEITEIISS